MKLRGSLQAGFVAMALGALVVALAAIGVMLVASVVLMVPATAAAAGFFLGLCACGVISIGISRWGSGLRFGDRGK